MARFSSRHVVSQQCLGQPNFKKDKSSPPFGTNPLYIPFIVSVFLTSLPFLILPFPSPPRSGRQFQLGDLRSAVSFLSGVRAPGPQNILVYFEMCLVSTVFCGNHVHLNILSQNGRQLRLH